MLTRDEEAAGIGHGTLRAQPPLRGLCSSVFTRAFCSLVCASLINECDFNLRCAEEN